MRGRPGAILLLAMAGLAILALASCREAPRSQVCAAQDSLRAALRAVSAARAADSAGDAAAVDREMAEVARLVGEARRDLAEPAADPATGPAARAMLEAANYLQFMVDDAAASGTVDFPIAQFAARELNRAGSGAGGAPLNC